MRPRTGSTTPIPISLSAAGRETVKEPTLIRTRCERLLKDERPLCSGRLRQQVMGESEVSETDLENSEGPREVALLEVLLDESHHIR